MQIIIISNGNIRDVPFHKEQLLDADMVICADGGANYCDVLKITPDYVIGDMDSVKMHVLDQMERSTHTTVIVDRNQNKTDTELAIELAIKKGATEIIMLGAIGNRMDHTFANFLSLLKFENSKIIDEFQEVFIVENKKELNGESGEIISVIPLTDVEELRYTGLKWGFDDDVKFGWSGICNVMKENTAKIRVESGKLLVMRVRSDT